MSKTLLFICILFFSSSYLTTQAQSRYKVSASKTVVFNQNVDFPFNNYERKMLNDVYGESLKENVLDNPHRLKSIKNIIRNRVEIISISNYTKDYKLLSQVPLCNKYNGSLKREIFNTSKFNPLKYIFDFYSKHTQVIRVDNTNNYIVIKPQHQN